MKRNHAALELAHVVT